MTTHRQPHLQVGERVALGGAGELQRHQEVGGLRTPRSRLFFMSRIVGLPGAGRKRDVVEAERPRVLDR